eukprot:GFYU01001556.1.p1 GENE.GFYU01001556.1~~GFYU01001556.1.p1  ORF type:complete len:453 (+),score=142.63 GFYU01001556.1:108-1466(+)
MSSALSLVCNDCKAKLKSAKEAQDHAEAFGHIDFAESVEAVLNLVCKDCKKPARTRDEADLHLKRTGHSGFDDKTDEAAAPLNLDPSAPPQSTGTSSSGAGPSQSGSGAAADGAGGDVAPMDGVEATAPEAPRVNEDVLKELTESMGFGVARAQRALVSCDGNQTIEAAVNWIMEHENDANIDEPLAVPPVAISGVEYDSYIAAKMAAQEEKSGPKLTLEEKRKKVEELRAGAKQRREAEEKRMEKERERDRIRSSKEIIQARRDLEEAERKRIAEQRKKEKMDEQRERQRLKELLEADKANRVKSKKTDEQRAQEEAEAAAKPKPGDSFKQMASQKASVVTIGEPLREELRNIKRNHEAQAATAFNTIKTFVGNVLKNPAEEKFRKIRLSNQAFQNRVGNLTGGIAFLEKAGFEKDAAGEFLVLNNPDTQVLSIAMDEVQAAIDNPFFATF